SLQAMRKFWPRAVMSTTGPPPNLSNTFFYDFNGNGVLDTNPYILDGRECLVFFLGGIRQIDASGNFGLTGFSRRPDNPYMDANPSLPHGQANPMYNNNRSAPLFEFAGNRLKLPPEKSQNGTPPLQLQIGGMVTGIPAYFDPYQTPGNPAFYAY